MKLPIPEAWEKDIARQTIIHIPQQFIDDDKQYLPPNSGEGTLQVDITISRYAYELLLDYIEKHEVGVVKTDRKEDLKLINRLMDLLNNSLEVMKK